MTVCVRYIVKNVGESIDFYTKHLGFKLEMHPSPPFAEISRDDLHIYLTEPQSGLVARPCPTASRQLTSSSRSETMRATRKLVATPELSITSIAWE